MPDLKAAGALVAAALAAGMPAPGIAQERTTATYEDWVLQCEIQPGPPAQKHCEIAQMTQMRGRNVTVSRIAIERPLHGKPVRLVAQVPVNVSLRAEVHIKTSEADPGWIAPFDRCLPSGCFADFDLKDDAIRKFRNAGGAGTLTFKNAGGQDVSIPISFKGFGPAFDALGKD